MTARTPTTAEALAGHATRALGDRDWPALASLLAGPLVPELMQPVLRVLRQDPDVDPQVLSDLARTLVRRLDVGAGAAVSDLRLWHEAPDPLRTARLDAWAKLAAGRRGDRAAALEAPGLWRALLEADGFSDLAAQAQAVALIEAAQAHWRAARRERSSVDLERAVELGLRAALTAHGLPHAAEALTVAGDAGLDLWRFGPRDGDLGRATEHARRALAQTPTGHPRHGWRAARVAGKLINLSIHEGTMAPLDEALDLLRRAPESTADPEDRCGVLHDLSRAAGRRWQIARDRDDVELAVSAARRAVDEVPPESLDVRIMRSGLATALRRRGEQTGDVEDLEEALLIRRELVAIETDEPRQGLVRSNLARSLRDLGQRTGRRELLDEAIETLGDVLDATNRDADEFATRLHDLARCYRARGGNDDSRRAREAMVAALEAADGRPEIEAQVAEDLGSMLMQASEPGAAARAYESALEALRRLQSRENHLTDRLVQLGRLENLPANAAVAALVADGPRAALSVADKGRTVVLSEILGRPAVPDTDDVPPDVLCLGAGDTEGFAVLKNHERTVGERCPQLTSAAVLRRVETLARALAGRREAPEAANAAIDDVARWLGETLDLERLDLPDHVAVVALGPLALLPIHLAPYAGEPLCLAREFTARLRPSPVRSPRPAPGGRCRAGLAISPASDRLPPLLFAEHETAALAQVVTRCTTLDGAVADRGTVLAAMRDADVAHFAGHARSLPDRPLDSSVYLSGDDILTVRDLLSSPSAASLELMALTGCETAMVGRRVPDESVSLAAAAVVAGAGSVLSTVWPVSQVAAALVCSRFYQSWPAQTGRPAAALAAAQRWMRDSPEEELIAACDTIAAPLTDPAQLREPLHWAAWTVTSA